MLENVLNVIFAPGRVLWTAVLATILLVGLGAHYADFAANQRQGFQWCLENPDPCDGREILLPVWDVVAVEPASYSVFKVTGPIPIEGDPTGLSVGDTVSIRGVFRKEHQAIVESSRTLHSRRPLKKALSGAGLLLFFFGIPFCLRIRNKRLVL